MAGLGDADDLLLVYEPGKLDDARPLADVLPDLGSVYDRGNSRLDGLWLAAQGAAELQGIALRTSPAWRAGLALPVYFACVGSSRSAKASAASCCWISCSSSPLSRIFLMIWPSLGASSLRLACR